MQPTSTGSRRIRLAVLAAILTLSALVPATASGAFHEMKIREVYAGPPNSGYVELQMYSAGQNFVSGHTIKTYDGTGAEIDVFTFPGNAANGQSQRTILVGGSAVPGATPDFVDNALSTAISAGAGAVCFDAIPVDCVAWGTFGGAGALPSPVGPVAAAMPPNTALVRSISAGCATLLEAGDDTDTSSADFALEPPNPRPNTSAPTETPCGVGGAPPQTVIDKGPRKQITGKKAKFKFSSPTAGASFECALDEKPFKPCESPFKLKRIKPGKHVFSVRAVAAGTPDPSPATYKFKRKRKPKK